MLSPKIIPNSPKIKIFLVIVMMESLKKCPRFQRVSKSPLFYLQNVTFPADVKATSLSLNATAYISGATAGKLLITGMPELATTGEGIVMKSPDGTRYKVTVANGGTIAVAAA